MDSFILIMVACILWMKLVSYHHVSWDIRSVGGLGWVACLLFSWLFGCLFGWLAGFLVLITKQVKPLVHLSAGWPEGKQDTPIWE